MTLLIHLGAHKTATTYFQSILENSKASLANAGIHYCSLGETRSQITSRLGPEDELAKGSELLAWINSCPHCILSDENIVGWIHPICQDNESLYPDLLPRVKRLLSHLKRDDIVFLFTIRDHVDYLLSRYCEYLRHSRFIPLEEYCSYQAIKRISWQPALADLRDLGFPVLISDFATVIQNEPAYLEPFLMGKPVMLSQACESRLIRRAKMSLEAYRVLLDASRRESPKFASRLMPILEDFQIGNTSLAELVPLDIVQICRSRYQDELDTFGGEIMHHLI